MKPLFHVLIPLLISTGSYCQEYKFWGDLKPGKFSVGFQDTVIFKMDEVYSYRGYSGAKPFYVDMWFPVKTARTKSAMMYSEYYNPDHLNDLDSLRKAVTDFEKGVFVESGITFNIDTWESMEYAGNEKMLFEAIQNTKVNAHRSFNFPKNKCPVIIYHHGSGGTREENAVLFEFLASYGFVVISCQYKYPSDIQGYHEQPIQTDSIHKLRFNPNYEKSIVDVEFIIRYVKQLSFVDPHEIYFIGHSRGAQNGLLLNQKGNLDIKAYILFDTTLEGYGLDAVHQMWPALYSKITEHSHDFKTKTYLITAPRAYYEDDKYLPQSYPEFQVFKFLDPNTFTLLNSKNPMNHNSFLSMGVIKKFYENEFKQPDDRMAQVQLRAYFNVVRLTLDILQPHQLDQRNFIKVR